MAGPGGDALRDVLAKRLSIVEALREEPKTKPTLTANLEHSRSTIDRAIEELLSVECIEPTATAGREFRLTAAGRAALEAARAYRRDTDLIGAHVDLLNAIPARDSLAGPFLAGANVYASEHTPDVAHEPGQRLVAGASRLIGTVPVVHEVYFDVLEDRLNDGDFELELVVASELRAAMDRTHAAEFATLAEREAVTMYETETSLPYALWVTEGEETHAGVTIHDGGGALGSIVNDDEAAVAWARETYEDYRANSTRVDG